MPITRSGYATQRRNGSTRAHRKARAQLLATEHVCWLCHKPGTPTNPLEAGHVTAHADLGTEMHAVHKSANRKLGRLPMTDNMRGNTSLCTGGA